MTLSTREPDRRMDVAALPADPSRLLEQLAALAHALSSAADLRTTYRALFTFAQVVGPTSGIFVSLYDPKLGERRCVFSAGAEGEDDVSTLPTLPLNGSPQSIAIATLSPLVTPDLQAALVGRPVVNLGVEGDPRLPQSSLAVPMIAFGRPIGAFEVQSLERAAYGSEHVVAMSLAGTIAALAIERFRAAQPKGQRLSAMRQEIQAIIAARAFSPVFQPIVELESRITVGYEALTRFDDGVDVADRFAQARDCGLGLDLEVATLEAAFGASLRLPANGWLNLNVSAEIVLAHEPLGSMLARWGWQTILELTEHVAVDDYDALRRAIRQLGENVRLAVDDAGAGFASFRHILELGPHFIKLDRAIVERIDVDPARQALVAGMRHFSVTTGCGLVAEGIETEGELQTLRALGISLGQGYLLGKPRAAG